MTLNLFKIIDNQISYVTCEDDKFYFLNDVIALLNRNSNIQFCCDDFLAISLEKLRRRNNDVIYFHGILLNQISDITKNNTLVVSQNYIEQSINSKVRDVNYNQRPYLLRNEK